MKPFTTLVQINVHIYIPVAKNLSVADSLSPGLMHDLMRVSCLCMAGPTFAKTSWNRSLSSRWNCRNVSGSSNLNSCRRLAYTPRSGLLSIQFLVHIVLLTVDVRFWRRRSSKIAMRASCASKNSISISNIQHGLGAAILESCDTFRPPHWLVVTSRLS